MPPCIVTNNSLRVQCLDLVIACHPHKAEERLHDLLHQNRYDSLARNQESVQTHRHQQICIHLNSPFQPVPVVCQFCFVFLDPEVSHTIQ